MRCNLNIPVACFNCPYPECRAENMPTKEETAFVRDAIESTPEDVKRREYYQEYWKSLPEEKKAKKRQKSREWYKAHGKEQGQNRKLYQHEYYLKRKERLRERV